MIDDATTQPSPPQPASFPAFITASGIDRFLAGEPLDKRPKIDVHTWDMKRKLVEKKYAAQIEAMYR